jgi:hypothetical protein
MRGGVPIGTVTRPLLRAVLHFAFSPKAWLELPNGSFRLPCPCAECPSGTEASPRFSVTDQGCYCLTCKYRTRDLAMLLRTCKGWTPEETRRLVRYFARAA